MVEQSVSLQPGESKLVSFEAVPHEAKTYHVSVNGLTGSFEAITPTISGRIHSVLIWYEPLTYWEAVTPGREIPIDAKIYLAPGWVNESEVNIAGHIDLIVTYPDGSEVSLIAVTNQDREATPGNGWSIQFQPFASTQEGTYSLTATLSSNGQVLDSKTFELIATRVIPEVVIDFPDLIILDVEGIPFTSVGVETMQNWEAFGEALQQAYGPTIWGEGYIADGVGLAMCIKVKVGESGTPTGVTLFQCGLEHSEYLTSFANSIPPSENIWLGKDWIERMGVSWPPSVGQVIADPSSWLSYKILSVDIENEVAWCTRTWNVTWWYRFPHQAAVDYCIGALAPYTGPIATLAEPIVMDVMRGISMTVVGKEGSGIENYILSGHSVITENYLWYIPTFDAPMPPPAFRGGGNILVGTPTEIGATGVFARGYYYPGIYDGKISVRWFSSYYGREYATYCDFMIKNLARVTGEGVI